MQKKTHYSRTACITNCCRHYWCVSGVFFCRGLLTVFMWWHSSVQFVWKPLCRGDDCSFTSQSPSERGCCRQLEWERGKSVCAWVSALDEGQITFSFSLSFWPWTLWYPVALTQHPWCTHVHTQIWSTKSCVPSSLAIVRHKPVKSVFGLVWA